MAHHSTPLGKFEQQRRHAKARGIQWEFSFEDWWAVWQESGKWILRGPKAGQYVMARRGDVGPYSRENVTICLASENSRDAHRNGRMPPPHLRKKGQRTRPAQIAQFIEGRPVRGWTYRLGHKKPYQVKFRNKYVTCYATQEEAEAAYARLLAAD